MQSAVSSICNLLLTLTRTSMALGILVINPAFKMSFVAVRWDSGHSENTEAMNEPMIRLKTLCYVSSWMKSVAKKKPRPNNQHLSTELSRREPGNGLSVKPTRRDQPG